jgi:hypothetical protein
VIVEPYGEAHEVGVIEPVAGAESSQIDRENSIPLGALQAKPAVPISHLKTIEKDTRRFKSV